MRFHLRVLVCLLFMTVPANAQNRVWHYVKTHKTVLAADTLGWLAMSADLASSIHCQKLGEKYEIPGQLSSTGCVETNPNLGPHPSERAYWLYGGSFEIAFTALRHLGWHFAPTRGGRYFIQGFIDVPTVAVGVSDTFDNIDAANAFNRYKITPNLREARARLLRKQQ